MRSLILALASAYAKKTFFLGHDSILTPVSSVFTVSLAATTANFTGFLCQARTDTNNYDTTVGTLAASGSVMMTENCGTVKTLFIKDLQFF